MAIFNENTINVNKLLKSDAEKISMTLLYFLSEEELLKLQEDYRKQNEGKTVKDIDFYPYWKFCLDKINVNYGGKK